MKLRYLFIILGISLSIPAAFSQADSSTRLERNSAVVENIEKAGNIKVNMPEKLKARLYVEPETPKAHPVVDSEEHPAEVKASVHSGKMGGYRIQVFSDSKPSTAKAEARARARNINARFPQFPTYVVYSSPYWRLRVGNFRTQDEANAAAHELKDAFPSYSREIRVVKDRIVVEGD